LSEEAWVNKLIVGHPDRRKLELGMRVHIYLALLQKLQTISRLVNSKYITLKEKVIIFLYTCVTGLSI
jgi:hypothetical protein